jgi:hypothetical protein
MTVLNFTEADLAANRQGRLSEAQKARLRARIAQTAILGLLVASLPLTFVVVSIGILTTSDQFGGSSESSSLVVVVVILIIMAALGLIPLSATLPVWRRARRALADGVVAAIDGSIDFEAIGSKRFALIVEDEAGRELQFNVKKGAHKAFDNSARYRIYFTPLLGHVVAAEQLDH